VLEKLGCVGLYGRFPRLVLALCKSSRNKADGYASVNFGLWAWTACLRLTLAIMMQGFADVVSLELLRMVAIPITLVEVDQGTRCGKGRIDYLLARVR